MWRANRLGRRRFVAEYLDRRCGSPAGKLRRRRSAAESAFMSASVLADQRSAQRTVFISHPPSETRQVFNASGINSLHRNPDLLRVECLVQVGSGSPISVSDTQSINGSSYAPAGRPSRFGLELPAADTKRWSSRRKAAVVIAIRNEMIARAEARRRYALSEEELAGREVAFDRRGIPGLRSAFRCSLASPPQNPAGQPSFHDPG
jgi:Protein of unknown function (DUF1153)